MAANRKLKRETEFLPEKHLSKEAHIAKILGISGSNRKGSYNRGLLEAALVLIARVEYP